MADFDAALDRAQADGRITTDDADEVRLFGDFLIATAGIPTQADARTPEQQAAFSAAYAEHYPDDYARSLAEQQARQEGPRG